MKRKYDLMYFVGDSWVYAISQSDDVDNLITINNRFSNLVASNYNLPCINHAIAGAGNEYITRTLYDDMYKFNHDGLNPFVVVVYSDPWRREIFSNKWKKSVIISETTVDFFKEYMLDHYDFEHAVELSRLLVLQCRTLCDRFNFDYVDAWTFNDPLDIPYYSKDKTLSESLIKIATSNGRFRMSDGNFGHPNILGHQRIANTLINKINELYS